MLLEKQEQIAGVEMQKKMISGAIDTFVRYCQRILEKTKKIGVSGTLFGGGGIFHHFETPSEMAFTGDKRILENKSTEGDKTMADDISKKDVLEIASTLPGIRDQIEAALKEYDEWKDVYEQRKADSDFEMGPEFESMTTRVIQNLQKIKADLA